MMLTREIVVGGLPVLVRCNAYAALELGPEMTHVEYGGWAVRWYEQGRQEVAGSVMTCLQQACILAWHRQQARNKRDQEGCCGEMEEDGRCWGVGEVCPAYAEATRLCFKIWRE